MNIIICSILKLKYLFQYGDTPLHTASRYGHAGVARILISAQANPNLQNKVRTIDYRKETNVATASKYDSSIR